MGAIDDALKAAMQQPAAPMIELKVAPTPGNIIADVIPDVNAKIVLMRVHTDKGIFFHILSPDGAIHVGEQLVAMGKQVKSNIIIPSPLL